MAALMVLISHVELIKSSMGISNHYKLMEHINFGGLGVYFFFVLSGFLITYLLLKENFLTENINIKHFYIRRILRIWPLYYLILFIGFFILPHIESIKLNQYDEMLQLNFNENLILYLLILPNLAFSIFPAVPHIGQSWSIIIKKFKPDFKKILFLLISIILLKTIFFTITLFYQDHSVLLILKKYIAMSKFESMLIGGLGAFILFEKRENLLEVIFNKKIFFLCIIGFLPLNYFVFYNIIQNGIHIIISFMFLVIIMNLGCNTRYKQLLENKIMNYLGTISYGIYMIHLMVIPFMVALFKPIQEKSILFNVSVYLLSIIVTIMISDISYRFFESYFLKIKKRFEK